MKRKKLISIVAAGMVFFLILTLILSLIPATVGYPGRSLPKEGH